jgi:hypothetical protein
MVHAKKEFVNAFNSVPGAWKRPIAFSASQPDAGLPVGKSTSDQFELRACCDPFWISSTVWHIRQWAGL